MQQYRYNAKSEPTGLLVFNTEMDGFLVDPAAFKAVVGRAERLGCVRFAHISATKSKRPHPTRCGRFFTRIDKPQAKITQNKLPQA